MEPMTMGLLAAGAASPAIMGALGGKGSGPSPETQMGLQTIANQRAIADSELLNRSTSQVTPFGQTYWVDASGNRIDPQDFVGPMGIVNAKIGDIAGMQQVTEMAPELQQIFGGLQGQAMARLGDLGQSMPGDFSDDRQRVEQALFDRAMSYARPEMERSREALEERLANQGIPIGSEAYTSEMDRLGRQQGLTTSNLLREAISGGGNEQSRLFGMDVTRRGIQSNELGQALGGIAGFRTPSAMPQNQVQMPAADVMGMYAQKDAQNQAKKGGATGLAGTLGSAALLSGAIPCERRLKRNITKVGKYKDHNIYYFQYKDSDAWHVGPMADEVAEIKPSAIMHINGVDHVIMGAL